MNEKLVNRWLSDLKVKRNTRYTYLLPVRSFVSYVNTRPKGAREVTAQVLAAWLQSIGAGKPSKLPFERVGIINRFLTWREQVGLGANPLRVLKKRHGLRIRGVLKILSEPNYEKRLSALPSYGWTSFLGPLMQSMLERRRTFGVKLERREVWLRRLDRFLANRPDLQSKSLQEIAPEVLMGFPATRPRLEMCWCLLALSREIRRSDPNAPVLEVEQGLNALSRTLERKPHVFSDEEVRAILTAASEMKCRWQRSRPLMAVAMVTVLYCTGIRFGELHSLRLQDVNWDERLLHISMTKFYKSRKVPFSPTVADALKRYIQVRYLQGGPVSPTSGLWWCNAMHRPYSYSFLHKLTTRLIRAARCKPMPGRQGPRIHDFRHTFAVHCLRDCYRAGRDPQQMLPYLATYMGHKDIESTLVYLTMTPDLMKEATKHFDAMSELEVFADIRA